MCYLQVKIFRAIFFTMISECKLIIQNKNFKQHFLLPCMNKNQPKNLATLKKIAFAFPVVSGIHLIRHLIF